MDELTNEFSRTGMLLGREAMDKLAASTVAVFGIGGVGGNCVEALARCGVGGLVLVDNDQVSRTNINRQVIATHKTIGLAKVEAMRDRILDINPNARVETHASFFSAQNADEFDFSRYDYIVDAIDTVSSKLLLIEKAQATGTPILSSMGTGNKLDPTRLEIADIYKTSVCPLAKVMRYELRRRGVKKLKVLYSRETPIKPIAELQYEQPAAGKRSIPGSVSFVPPAAGLIIAGEVIRTIAGVFPLK